MYYYTIVYSNIRRAKIEINELYLEDFIVKLNSNYIE